MRARAAGKAVVVLMLSALVGAGCAAIEPYLAPAISLVETVVGAYEQAALAQTRGVGLPDNHPAAVAARTAGRAADAAARQRREHEAAERACLAKLQAALSTALRAGQGGGTAPVSDGGPVDAGADR